ncbi:transposase [Holospora obtusa F1]|uniref:Transposase n=1 Tax=Holospora obtusa F1 TaxID=1399147 RepID=W6TE42_HOLOB|nr:hypothetical protein [Holospora obtusa]ETZ06889.1 transposase [Holospora obtusa F1]
MLIDHLVKAGALMNHFVKTDAVLFDKVYDADERGRRKLKEKGRKAVIPPKKNCFEPSNCDQYLYKSRHLIENFSTKLKAVQLRCHRL